MKTSQPNLSMNRFPFVNKISIDRFCLNYSMRKKCFYD